MTRYLALLRGINLGPYHRVPMQRLREMAEELGYTDVVTHINSGNLLVTTDRPARTVARELAERLEREFGFPVPVVVRTADQLRVVVGDDPFPDGDPAQVQVAFCTELPPPRAAEGLQALVKDERVAVRGSEIWVDYPSGIGQSKVGAAFDRATGVVSTARNLRTVRKLLELLER